ncbi:MAG: hypothetical protein ACPLPT_10490 [Moorellales bacterium]
MWYDKNKEPITSVLELPTEQIIGLLLLLAPAILIWMVSEAVNYGILQPLKALISVFAG